MRFASSTWGIITQLPFGFTAVRSCMLDDKKIKSEHGGPPTITPAPTKPNPHQPLQPSILHQSPTMIQST
jgi:hypothetical protein